MRRRAANILLVDGLVVALGQADIEAVGSSGQLRHVDGAVQVAARLIPYSRSIEHDRVATVTPHPLRYGVGGLALVHVVDAVAVEHLRKLDRTPVRRAERYRLMLLRIPVGELCHWLRLGHRAERLLAHRVVEHHWQSDRVAIGRLVADQATRFTGVFSYSVVVAHHLDAGFVGVDRTIRVVVDLNTETAVDTIRVVQEYPLVGHPSRLVRGRLGVVTEVQHHHAQCEQDDDASEHEVTHSGRPLARDVRNVGHEYQLQYSRRIVPYCPRATNRSSELLFL